MKKGSSILKKIIIFIVCVMFNFVGRTVASKWNLPIWGDMAGTFLAVYYLGLAGGVAVGVFNNILYAFLDPTALIYALTGILAAVAFWVCVKSKMMEDLSKVVGASIIIGFLCVIVSTPLNLQLYHGYSGNFWGDALVDMFLWYGFPTFISATAGEIIVEVVDKQICVLLAYGIICAGKKWTAGREKKKAKQSGNITAALLAGAILSMELLGSSTLLAEATNESNVDYYMGHLYNNSNGMMASEANAIEETPDGFIWIGSYAGLTRYDGKNFTLIKEGGIASVTALHTDRQGRLWIGTNDRGLVRYENGDFVFFGNSEGFGTASIRCFAETENGELYVGTTDKVYRVDNDNQITALDGSLHFVTSMAYHSGVLAGVDASGQLFVYKDGQVSFMQGSGARRYYNCVVDSSNGILVGTASSGLGKLVIKNGEPRFYNVFTDIKKDITAIEEDCDGKIWVCAGNSIAYYDPAGAFHVQKVQGFDTGIECIHEDYQGNIWVASSRQGVLKLAKSCFRDLFEETGAEKAVTNAVVEFNGRLYCGTDSGLVILKKDGSGAQETALTKRLKDARIRGVMVDSRDRLWICTYQEMGLICYEKSERITTYNTGNSTVTGDKFRCVYEMQDGTIAAGTTNGLNLIKDGKVVGTFTKENGLENQQILCLMEDENGTLYVGTDGAGIYLVKGGEVVGRYSVSEGLSSNIILRMIPYDKGIFAVTSNAICFIEEQGIRVLSNFPYFNNYDVIIKDRNAYVLSSAGVFVVNAQKLVSGANLMYRLYNVTSGLPAALTVNSWNLMDGKMLYLCGNNGLILFDDRGDEADDEYLFGISGLECDGMEMDCNTEELWVPAGTKRITITPSVRNYLLTNIKARFYVEGVEVRPQLVNYDELQPLTFTNLTHGEYRIRFQIYDSTGTNILEEKIYTLIKQPQVWENTWYKIYLVIVCVEMVAFLSWAAFLMRNVSKRKVQLEKLRKELEMQVDEQMQVIIQQSEKSEKLLHQVVAALSETVDAKDRYTSGHSKRVAEYSKAIAARMGKSEAEQEEIFFAGLLHDVGKIRIPDEIINKPGKLDDQEFNYIKLHPVAGYHILKDISGNRKFSEGARFHHERFDGRGYPNGLQGNNIPEIARIIGVADAYDAMASNRSYRRALPQEVVRSEIEKGKGTQFDPIIADVMLQLIDEDAHYSMKEMDDRKKTILVVDDELMNIKLVQFLLRDENMFDIVSAINSEKTLELVRKGEVDMILLDIEMPEMNGFELLAKIREIADIPVVFMTANKDLATIQKAEELGVEDYLTKPILPIALKEVVHSVLK